MAQAMSELQIIESALQQAARRRRWARALRGMWTGLLAGSVVSLSVIVAWHLLPLPLWMLTVAALVPFPCALAGMIVGGWRNSALPEVARWVDGRQHLQERLSTALEVAGESNAANRITHRGDRFVKIQLPTEVTDRALRVVHPE